MMRKSIYKILLIAFLIVFVILVVPLVLFIPTHVDSEESVHQPKVAGLLIQFRDGITEPEVKNIPENYDLTAYKLDYNVYGMQERYYIMVDKDKMLDLKGELEEENWTVPTQAIEKGNYYIIMIPYEVINDKSFIETLNKYNLQKKMSVWCHVIFTDRPESGISQEKANELKHELETNENIFTVLFESIES